MAAELIMAPEAEQDIAGACAWYEGQRPGLGQDFVNCVDACFQGICRHPTIHRFVQGTYRRALVRRFPYAVFYEYADDKVVVYCVFHTARSQEMAATTAMSVIGTPTGEATLLTHRSRRAL